MSHSTPTTPSIPPAKGHTRKASSTDIDVDHHPLAFMQGGAPSTDHMGVSDLVGALGSTVRTKLSSDDVPADVNGLKKLMVILKQSTNIDDTYLECISKTKY
jgi:hypothetical protein